MTPDKQIKRINQRLTEIQKELHEIRLQQGLFEGRLTSEQGNMTRHIDALNREVAEIKGMVRGLELWQSQRKGTDKVGDRIIIFIITILTGVIIWLITKQ